MKKNLFPSLFAVLPMLFLVASCATDPNIESARLALVQADYQEVISSAEAALETNPENADAYYYIGVAHAYTAMDKPADQREELYSLAHENLIISRDLFTQQEARSSDLDKISDVIIEVWGYEYNQGIEPLSDDIFSSTKESLELARSHFRNAIVINPDSVQSFNLLAEINFALGDFEEAKEVTRHIIFNMDQGDLFNYYRLAYFLMETDNDQEAVELLLQARDIYPDEIDIVQEIANSYLRLGETEKALEVVQELIERDPENAQYRLVYATQVYQMVQNLDAQIREIHDAMYDMSRELRQKARQGDVPQAELEAMSQEIEKKQHQAAELIEQSHTLSERTADELLIGLDIESDNAEIHSTLGIIYQNRAALLQDQRNMAEDLEVAQQFDDESREFLLKAIPHFKAAIELQEDDVEHWRSLFRIYTNLGMMDEAAEAQEKSGL